MVAFDDPSCRLIGVDVAVPKQKSSNSESRPLQSGRSEGLSAQKEHIRGLLSAASENLALDPVEALALANQALQQARSVGDLPLHGEAALALAAAILLPLALPREPRGARA